MRDLYMNKDEKRMAKAVKHRQKKINQAIDRAAAGFGLFVILAALVQELMNRGVVKLHPFSVQNPNAPIKESDKHE